MPTSASIRRASASADFACRSTDSSTAVTRMTRGWSLPCALVRRCTSSVSTLVSARVRTASSFTCSRRSSSMRSKAAVSVATAVGSRATAPSASDRGPLTVLLAALAMVTSPR